MNFQIYDENFFGNASSGLVLISYLLCARSAYLLTTSILLISIYLS
jgi:hypothetical protein